GKWIYDDCYIKLGAPLAFQHGANGGMAGLEIIDSDILVNWNESATSKCLIETWNNSEYSTTLGDIVFKNNVVWSNETDVQKEFHITHGQHSTSAMNINSITIENNTFYNATCGLNSASNDRFNALIAVHETPSFSVSGNIFYVSKPTNKTTDATDAHHYCIVSSNSMSVDAMKEAGKCEVNNLVNLPQQAGLRSGTGAKEWNWGLTNLTTLQDNDIVTTWVNPFSSEDIANGVFTVKAEYATSGAKR
ncbi:MAG: hypothetical protein ACI395_02785, partial [Candidatus Cryptobacteroides sp.]